MNLSFQTLTVDNLELPTYETNIDEIISKILGLRRNNTTSTTSLPFDNLVVSREIESLISVRAPQCLIGNITFLNDKDAQGASNRQFHAFTPPLWAKLTGTRVFTEALLTKLNSTEIFTLAQSNKLNDTRVFTQSMETKLNSYTFGYVGGVMTINAIETGSLTINNPGVSLSVKGQIVQNGTSDADRQITSTYYNFRPQSGSGSGSRIFHDSGNNLFISGLQNNSVIQVAVRDGVGNQFIPMTINTVEIALQRRINFTSTSIGSSDLVSVGNVVLDVTKNGRISQGTTILPSVANQNLLGKSSIRIKHEAITGGATTGLEILDENPTIRGLMVIPNVSQGAYNNIVASNDILVTTRPQNDSTLTLAPWASHHLGIRITPLPEITLRCNASILTIANLGFVMNNHLTFTGTNRRINDCTGLRLIEPLINTNQMELYLENTTFNLGLTTPSGLLVFTVRDAASTPLNIITADFGSTSFFNNVSFRNSTVNSTFTRFAQSDTGLFIMTGTSSAAINSELRFSTRNSAGVTSSALNIRHDGVYLDRPLNHMTPTSLAHIGFIFRPNLDSLVISVFNQLFIPHLLYEVILPFVGTYQIEVGYRLTNIMTNTTLNLNCLHTGFSAQPNIWEGETYIPSQDRSWSLTIPPSESIIKSAHQTLRAITNNSVFYILISAQYDPLLFSRPNATGRVAITRIA